ncbi:hypothetical protein H2248_006865 [Termitomyces sp. 'cryptogamus']|nr:hypothetical protein H2248_006865 [Termitomyces sp. 'cryptogamus']
MVSDTSDPRSPSTPTPITRPAPSTPRSKVPLYTPHTPKTGPRPCTPEADYHLKDDSHFSPALIPEGNQLIVQGCVSDLSTDTLASMVRDLLHQLSQEPLYNYFDALLLDRPSNVLSACYVKLRYGGTEASAEPRADLLETVLMAIAEARRNWKAQWCTSRKGHSNKHLLCCLLDLYPGVTDHSGIPPADLAILKEHIKKQGYCVASIFASYGGPQVTFLLLADADRFMALGSIAVPSKVSKCLSRIELLKEIPIERSFKLVVTGMRDWDQMEGKIKQWVCRTAPKAWMLGVRPPISILIHLSS